jgi:RNA polymerase sigma factor (sigma-70 family)
VTFLAAAVYQDGIGRLRPDELRPPNFTKGYAMRDDPVVIALVARVREGDQEAWDEVVERYSPLVWSICVRYRLSRQDADDVGQSVWLLLVEQIGSLREPAALPGWLATTTRRECLRVLRSARRHDAAGLPPEDQMPADPAAVMVEDEVIAAERDAALRAAFAELPGGCHQLLSMLVSDPPCSYAAISSTLQMPVGSIGPMRARCLERLRRSPHLAAVLGGPARDPEGSTR